MSSAASSPAVQAFKAYQAHFKAAAQVKVILNDPGHDLRQAQYSHAIAQVAPALSQVEHITGVQAPSTATTQSVSQQFFATDVSAVAITLSLAVDPSSLEARQTVDPFYTAAAGAQHGTPLAGPKVLPPLQNPTHP